MITCIAKISWSQCHSVIRTPCSKTAAYVRKDVRLDKSSRGTVGWVTQLNSNQKKKTSKKKPNVNGTIIVADDQPKRTPPQVMAIVLEIDKELVD